MIPKCKYCESNYVNCRPVKDVDKTTKVVCKECLMVTYIHDERGVL